MDIFTSAIAAALGNLGSAAVLGAYQAVKTLVLHKFGADHKVAKAIEELEQEPDSDGWKLVLQEAAKKSGADKDEEIIKAAQALLEAVKAQAGGIGMDIGTFKAAKLEVSDVVAEEKGTAVRMKEVDIEGTATFSKIGGSRPNQ
jgi:hypothetical protein